MFFIINLFKFIIGSVLGSFITLSSTRSTRHESVLFPASHCDYCQHKLYGWELIPILSFIILGGRCHNCHHSISPVTFIGESLGGLIILANPLSAFGIMESIFELLLLFIAECDYENYLIPGWSIILLLFISQSQLLVIKQFNLKVFLMSVIIYKITLIFNHHYRFIGNGDVDILFILFLKLNLSLTLIIITISSALAIVKYMFSHSSRLIPYLPYLSIAYLLVNHLLT